MWTIARFPFLQKPIEVVSLGEKPQLPKAERRSTALQGAHAGLIINRTGPMTDDELCVNTIRFLLTPLLYGSTLEQEV